MSAEQQLMEADIGESEETLGDLGETTKEVTQEVTPEQTSNAKPEDESKAEEAFFDVDGERISLSQLREWRGGFMKDADYRQKTSELAERRRDFESTYGELEPYLDTINYLQTNPELLNKVNELIQGSYSPEGEKDSEAQPKWAQDLQSKFQDMELDKQISKLKADPMFAGKFDDAKAETDLLKYAQKHRMNDLGVAARSFLYDKDVAAAKLSGEEAVTQGLKNKEGIKPPISDGAGMSTPPKSDRRNMSMDEIFDKTVSEDLFT